ncbi:MAG: redox-sensing transcriptional repressor Rex [Anaerolineae bacterium]|nr:redox-sensing transcriptional repressor Rex [Anaerolineae bacterium]
MRELSIVADIALNHAPRRRRAPAPEPIIQRLPLYLSCLQELLAAGKTHISSDDLGARVGICGALARSDLSHFGAFGVRGLGYEIDCLVSALEQVLGVNRKWDVVLVGAGELGCALALSAWFQDSAFRLSAIFDCDPRQTGRQVGDLTVALTSDAPGWVREHDVKVAILAFCSCDAQAVADLLIGAGIRIILNYTSRVLQVPPEVRVTQFNPVAALQEMVCHLGNGSTQPSAR